ncbi:MAG: 50S ribosomal protein L4 [Caldilineaceae bacterium]
MLFPLKNMAGEQVGEIDLNDAIFGASVSKPLMHQALVRQLSNARLGTHNTKTRSEVAGGGRKPFRQKGTGRARQGSIRASQWVGGGTVFGPRPRKYVKQLPKKMNAAALRSALSVKAASEQIVVVDTLQVDAPKTKVMVQALSALGVATNTILMVIDEKNTPIQRSVSNLPNVKTVLTGYINIRDLLGYDTLLLSKDAVESIELWLTPTNGGSEEEEVVDVPAEEPVVAEQSAAVASTDSDDSTEEISNDEALTDEASTEAGA